MPELSVSRPRALAGAVLLLCVLVVAGRFLLGAGAASAPEAEVVAEPIQAEAPPRVVVHVVGAVRRPVCIASSAAGASPTRSRAPAVRRRTQISR